MGMQKGVRDTYWRIASQTLALVTVAVLTGGTLYLVFDHLEPPTPPEAVDSSGHRTSSLPRSISRPKPAPRNGPQSQTADNVQDTKKM